MVVLVVDVIWFSWLGFVLINNNFLVLFVYFFFDKVMVIVIVFGFFFRWNIFLLINKFVDNFNCCFFCWNFLGKGNFDFCLLFFIFFCLNMLYFCLKFVFCCCFAVKIVVVLDILVVFIFAVIILEGLGILI